MATEGTPQQLSAQFDAWLALTAAAGTGADTGAAAGGDGTLLRLPMRTGSMHPALPRGCTLLIAPLPGGAATATAAGAATTAARDAARARAARPGQVSVFARDGRLTAHRVLRRARRDGRPWVLEMGDANPGAAWRPLDEVVGIVVGAESAGGVPLPAPASRSRAWRLLLRLARARIRGLARRGGQRDENGDTPTEAP